MQFYSASFLNLLLLTPILIFCFIASTWLRKKRIQSLFQSSEIQEKLLPHYKKNEWSVRSILLIGAFIFSVLALSQPQWGQEKRKIERKGVDIIFMLDVSASMLAEDTKPSRVHKAKFEIESFIKELKGDRVGMLTFAGSSFMQTPLTLDYSAFLTFLTGVDVGHVPDPGTSLGPAIQRALGAFPLDKGKHQALIIFSDGEDHEMQIESAVEEAKKKNVRIYTVGTGSVEGAPIPLKDDRGKQTAVKKDRLGQIVITKLNKEILSKIAAETGGLYLPASPREKEVALILKHLQTLGEKKLEDRLVTEREDHYQIFVFLALLCLISEMLVRRSTSATITTTPLSVIAIIFFLHCGFISTPQQKVEEGNKDFEEKKYQSAIQKYRSVKVKNPDTTVVDYNLATSLYKINQYPESVAHLKKTVEKSSKNPEFQARAAYNYGNALYRVGDYEGAINAYKKALAFNPKDQDAKYNLEFLIDKKSKFDKQNQDKKKNDPEKKDDKNQQNNEENKKDQTGGGGNSQQDKSQGKGESEKQPGSNGQDQNENQGGKGQNQTNSGENQDPSKKDAGKGQNQKDDKQQGTESEPNKEQNKNAGGQGEKDKKENETQNNNTKGDQDSDQKDQSAESDSSQDKNQPDKGAGKKEERQAGGADNTQNSADKPDDKSDEQPNKAQPQQQPGAQGQQESPEGSNTGQSPPGQQPGQQPGQSGSGNLSAGKPLQGQMSKEDAEYLLSSLEEGEKKFHVLRKATKEHSDQTYVEKDW